MNGEIVWSTYTCKSVHLYQVKDPYWLTDATIGAEGDLVITSGNASSEWWITIRRQDKPALIAALAGQGALMPESTDDPDIALLEALAERFTGDENPFENIKADLRQWSVPSTGSCWTGMPW